MKKLLLTTITVLGLGLNLQANTLENVKGKMYFETNTFERGSFQGEDSISAYISINNLLNKDLTVGVGIKTYENTSKSNTPEYNVNTYTFEYPTEELKITEKTIFSTYTLNRFINITGKLTNQTSINKDGDKTDNVNTLELLTYITKYINVYYTHNLTDKNKMNIGIEANKSFMLLNGAFRIDTKLGSKYQWESNLVITDQEEQQTIVYVQGKMNYKLKKDVEIYAGIHWDNEYKSVNDFKTFFGISYKF